MEDKSRSRARVWGRRSLIVLAFVLLAGVLLVGPWPSRNRDWVGTPYARATFDRVAALRPKIAREGALLAGVAEVEITPESGQPLMGFSSRDPLGREGVESANFARALTLRRGDVDVTILTGDYLLIMENLYQEVLRLSGLRPEQLYCTASHTHSGPGGWARGMIVEAAYGRYRQEEFDRIAHAMAEAILASRTSLQPVRIRSVAVDVPQWQENRIDAVEPLDSWLRGLIVEPLDEQGRVGEAPLAVLVSYAAHATVYGDDKHDASSDYPGVLAAALQHATGAKMVLFAAGASGDARPTGLDLPGMRAMGEDLAGRLAAAMPESTLIENPELASVNLPVDLMPMRIPLSWDWQVSPLATWWVLDRSTHLSVVRVGPVILVGLPADVTGGLALRLRRWCADRGLQAWVTSFNGDWKGYLTRSCIWREHDCYETRMTGFFGPYAGAYMFKVAEGVIARVAPEE